PSLEPKSPHQKRSPASRSSCGIETSTGPPPALSTQRSLSYDKSRPNTKVSTATSLHRPRSFGSTARSKTKPQPPRPASSIDEVLNPDSSTTATGKLRQRSSLPIGTSTTATGEKAKMPLSGTRLSGGFLGSNSRERKYAMAGNGNTDTSSKESLVEDGKSKNEDIFLNIARANSLRRSSTTTMTERKRSKFGLSGLSSRTSRANEEVLSPQTPRFDSDQVTPSPSHDDSPSLGLGSSSLRSPTTSQHPIDENSRLRYFGVSTRSSVGLPRSSLTRASQEPSPDSSPNHIGERRVSNAQEQMQGQSRTYRQSNLSTMRSTLNSSVADAVAEQSRLEAEKSRLDGTESTLSTTAPSTVWDELDDLKSRIRKLELTGKLPPSSAAAMCSVSGERPRTATTTVTTLSSSPKHGRKTTSPPLGQESSTVTDQIHPLLHTALAKAKPILNADVYRTLEATTTDALTLAAILSSNAPQHRSGMPVNGASTSDRQMRRKADSLCRGLTELCLVLSDQQRESISKTRTGSPDPTTSQYQRDGVMDRESITPTISYRRSISHEPEECHHGQTQTMRLAAGSRLETRRASILSLNSGAASSRNTQESANQTQLPTPTLSTPPSRLNRTSITLRSRRLQGEEDSEDKSSVVFRPISRAMTEINSGTSRYSPRERRRSREYTSNHPLPDQHVLQQISPQQHADQAHPISQVQSNIPVRRNYGTPGTSLPTTTHTNIQPGFRRYGASSLNTGTKSADASPNDHNSGASGLGTKHTGLLQLRSRTNSTGMRRIGIRNRPFFSTDGDNEDDELD
ncbi:LPXTG-motif cell wall anchor domain protein, partial [Histoplasma capsulatum]